MKPFEKITPQPGQESVWDYPRPPRIEATTKTLKIEHQGIVLAQTQRAFRVLETSHPPVYYIPQEDILMAHLSLTDEVSFCEFKGKAHYYHLQIGNVIVRDVAWTYLAPPPKFEQIKDYLAFYPHKVDACYVNDEKVQAQEGGFYGGWITKDIVGPFKGGTGTWGW